ncbi:MAG: rhodanese-related sulfurtransferase [Burkholderiaceae bacterium]|nr:rhodanese-related sulfurtransferase [Burkholderiaceae bacterium]
MTDISAPTPSAPTSAAPYLTAAFYKFVELADFADLKEPLLAFCELQGVKGTILLANEGINSTIAGPEAGVRAVLAYLRADPRLTALEHKESWSAKPPFYRMKVKLKREIVTMGVPTVKPNELVGKYVKPEDWNALISDPDVLVIDTRNTYEVDIGTFKGAVDPRIKSFSLFPEWLMSQPGIANSEARKSNETDKKTKVAMFCTGGIRCEKSTAFLRAQGFEEVYHLQGGILKYLETVPEAQSLWQGECFVFDERVTVGQGLKVGDYGLCRACREPISQADMASPLFVLGLSCPHCHASKTDEQKGRFLERQRQIELAKQRHQPYIGVKMPRKEKAETLEKPIEG